MHYLSFPQFRDFWILWTPPSFDRWTFSENNLPRTPQNLSQTSSGRGYLSPHHTCGRDTLIRQSTLWWRWDIG
jgi:hypothetical protein